MENEIECFICGSNEIPDISKKIFHKCEKGNHYFCEICLKDSLRICTCHKNISEIPKIIVLNCPCTMYTEPDQEEEVKRDFSREYFDIFSNETDKKTDIGESFPSLLTDWYGKYKVMSCCRGCLYERNEIQTNVQIAAFSSIQTCIYDLNNVYLNDEIDQNFINALPKDLVQKLGLDQLTEI